MDTNHEPRIICELGLDARIAAIIEPAIEELGFRLVRVRMINVNGMTMQIMAERPDGSMSVGECEQVSRAISPLLDIDDPVSQAYSLEVSSPGIDRPLVRRSDFEIWSGHVAKIELVQMIDGRKRFRGKLLGVENDTVKINRDNAAAGEQKEFVLPLNSIAEAKLVLTDELVREALKKDKSLRAANGLEVELPNPPNAV